jgi:hypothetical protein
MDLVHPEDKDLVMAQWNTIAQGSPVTFEMRWKPRPGTDDTAQWVLSACVPIFDDDKTLISIAGNTIDINAQKKSQEATQLRLEALEQARISELKFARFAQLSPTAIYIFVPGVGELCTHPSAGAAARHTLICSSSKRDICLPAWKFKSPCASKAFTRLTARHGT